MTGYPTLTHIGVGLLIGEAGGDPWQIDATLHSGDPGEISALSRAFFDAGACTDETYRDFVEAQRRFRAAWNRESGDHPINDGAEVARAMGSVLFARDQLPVIAAELARVAACLAEVQKASSGWIGSLNTELHLVDQLIDQALAQGKSPSALESRAINSATIVVRQVKSLRDGYSADLAAAQTKLRVDGHFDPAIDEVDGDNAPGPVQHGRDALDYYDRNQRAADELAGDDPGASDRLRDFRTATDPGADETARALAGERLDDFRMSQFVGPLTIDPLLGGDARTRARSRLELQQRLETGTLGLSAMTADGATRALDDAEHTARVITAKDAVAVFTGIGMTRTGARRCVDLLSKGTSMRALLEQDSTMLAAGDAGTGAALRGLPTGVHGVELFSAVDIEVLRRIGRGAKVGGFGIDAVTGLGDLHTGQTTPLRLAGRLAGGAAVGWGAEAAAWAAAGSFIGPEGALAAGLVASVLLSGVAGDAGEKAFGALGS